MEGLVDVLTLCNYCILANVLDFRTYSFPDLSFGERASKTQIQQRILYDYNALSPVDRDYYSYVRGLAKNLMVWISTRYRLTEAGNALKEIPFGKFSLEYLMDQARAILNYKRQDENTGLVDCTAKDVERQLNRLFSGWLDEYFDLSDVSDADTLACAPWPVDVQPRTEPSKFTGIVLLLQFLAFLTCSAKESSALSFGTTLGDKMFKRGIQLRFSLNQKGSGSSDSPRASTEDEESEDDDEEDEGDDPMEVKDDAKDLGKGDGDSEDDDAEGEDEDANGKDENGGQDKGGDGGGNDNDEDKSEDEDRISQQG